MNLDRIFRLRLRSRAFARISLASALASAVLIAPLALQAHDPQPSSEETADYTANRHAGLKLTAKLVPVAALEASAGAEDSTDALHELALDYARQHAQNEDLNATVGDIAYLVLRLERGGRPVRGAQFQLSFDHIEDDKLVFETNSGATDGSWVWGQQFFDGAQHRVRILARERSGGEALDAQFVVAVEGLSPPAGSIFRSLFLLLSVVALGMVAGYWFGVRGAAGRNL
ncbi:MAG: hypothetical protein NXI24_06230 [bacterium]|nr:hypothetical protein [bacterium]